MADTEQQPVEQPVEPIRVKTLHELNQEAWATDLALRGEADAAAEAAAQTVRDTLAGKRTVNKRVQKNLRPAPKAEA